MLELDDDCYPTQETLEYIENYPVDRSFFGLMEQIRTIWNMQSWGWSQSVPVVDEQGRTYINFRVSTGGWSGNEDIIRAMKKNKLFWSLCWVSSRRGGHHEFEVKDYDI